MTALTIRGVTKSFGPTRVLRGVDLHVPSAGLTAVLGPSGCGKTTLLRLVAGFTSPDGGTIEFDDRIVWGPRQSTPPQLRRVGYVPQEGALFPHLTVADNITFGLVRRARRARARVGELLEVIGLETGYADRYPHELSGGQQQRVALARALAPEPAVVLLDEPFASLDAGLREGTRRAVAEALRATKATAVLVTHDQAEALSMADEVAVMREGLVVQLDRPRVVYDTPSDTSVASFVGEAVLLAAWVAEGQADCALGRIPLSSPNADGPPDGRSRVLVRPEQIHLHDAAAEVGVEAHVTGISYFGHDAAVRLQVGTDATAVTARVLGRLAPPPGTRVRLTVSGTAIAYPLGETDAPAASA